MAGLREAMPDLHHKMSKKIAQLTKVIFHLNTKNEDNETTIKALNDHHENEISEILNDAAAKINKFKEKLTERRELAASHELIDELKKQHEREKNDAIRDIKEFKRKASQREATIKKEYNNRLDALKSELEITKEGFEERISKFNDIISKLRKSSKSSGKHSEKLKKELADAVQEGNEKYQSMLSKRMNIEDKLKETIKTMKKEHEQQVEKLESDFETKLLDVKSKHLSEMNELKDKMNKENNEEMNEIKKRMTSQQGALIEEIEEQKQQMQVLNNQYLACKNDSNRYQEEVKGLEKKILLLEELKTKAEAHNSEYLSEKKMLEEKVTSLETSKEKLDDLLEQVKAELRATTGQNENLQKSLETARNSMAKDSKASTERETFLQNALEKHKKHALALNAELDKLRSDYDNIQSSNSKTITSLKNDLNLAQMAQEKTTKEIERLQKLTSELQSDKLQLQKNVTHGDKNLGNLKTKHENTLKSLETAKAKQKELEILLRSKNQELDAIVEGHKHELEKVNNEHINIIEKLKTEMEETIKRSQKEVQSNDVQNKKLISDLKKEKEKLEHELKRKLENMGKELAAESSRLSLSNTKCKELEAKIKHGSIELTNIKKKHEEKLQKMESEFKKKLDSSEAKQLEKNNLVIKNLKERYESLIQEASVREDKERQKVISLEKLLSEAKAQVLELTESMKKSEAEYRKRQKDEADEFLTKLQSLKDEENSKRMEMEQRFQAVVHETKADYENKISTLKAQHANTVHELKVESEAKEQHLANVSIEEKRQLREGLEKQHLTNLETVKSQLRSEFSNIQKEIQSKHGKKIEELRKKMTRDTTEKISALKMQQKQEIDAYRDQIRKGETERCQLEQENKRMCENNQNLQRDMEEKVNSFQKEKKSLEEKWHREFSELSIKHKMMIDDEVKKHAAKERELHEQMNALKEQNDEISRDFACARQDWEIRYRDRESRPEDVNEINALKKKVVKCERKVKQTIDEMKYFKMELENREENYNKMFGSSPNVGVGFGPMNLGPGNNGKSDGKKIRKKSKDKTLPPLGSGSSQNNNYTPQHIVHNNNNAPLRPNSGTRRPSHRNN